jgi:hypothetical protein
MNGPAPSGLEDVPYSEPLYSKPLSMANQTSEPNLQKEP